MFGPPEEGRGRVVGRRLDRKFDVGLRVIRIFRSRRIGSVTGSGWWGCYGEATGFGDGGDVDVEPLAREVTEGRLLRWKGLE